MRRRAFSTSLVVLALALASLAAQEITVPNRPNSVKFGVMGDNGNGSRQQAEVGAMMAKVHEKFRYDSVIMLGDNMYGSQSPKDFETKFAIPYKTLLDRGVKFYAALGNHDNQENRFYKPWNMGGERFYTFEKGHARFFVLDTDYLDPKQMEWIERELRNSKDDWKIVYFHHPLYSSAGRHGSDEDLRTVLEPLFIKYGVNVVFQGHDHTYERVKPQRGIVYFVSGSAGQLRPGDLRKTEITAAGYDQDQSFMIVEIDKDEMFFQAITRTGKTVDSGTIAREKGANQENAKPVPTTGIGPAPGPKPAATPRPAAPPNTGKPEAPAAKPAPTSNGKPATPSAAKPDAQAESSPPASGAKPTPRPGNETEARTETEKPKKKPWYCALFGC